VLLHFWLAAGAGMTPVETDSSGLGAVVVGAIFVGIIFLISGGGKGGKGGKGGGRK
jgi:hypothetical protein